MMDVAVETGQAPGMPCLWFSIKWLKNDAVPTNTRHVTVTKSCLAWYIGNNTNKLLRAKTQFSI
jgi:hypothetical protein